MDATNKRKAEKRGHREKKYKPKPSVLWGYGKKVGTNANAQT